LLSKNEIKYFHKILNLYYECVISVQEACDLVKVVFEGKKGEYLLYESYKEMIESRQSLRRKTPSNLFKPLNEQEFTKEQRIGISYAGMP